MTNSELEARLRAARPMESEIAPLTPERSAAILSRALAANRKQDGGMMMPFLLSSWRPTLAAAFAAMGAVLIFRLTETPSSLPVVEGTPSTQATTRLQGDTPLVEKESHPKQAMTGDAVAPSMATPVAGSNTAGLSQKRLRRALPAATVIPVVSHALWANANRPRMSHHEAALPEAALPKSASLKSVAAPSEEDGPLLVAASGVPDDDMGELRVQVQENVPNTVPGRAEAASVRLYADTPYQAAPTDYWAHARVATDSEPTLTLTALR